MILCEDYYTFGIKEKKLPSIVKSIEKGREIKKLFAVTLPLGSSGILEIYEYNKLLEPLFASLNSEPFIVGLAPDKEQAEELVEAIIQDVYDNTGEKLDVKGYFKYASYTADNT